MDASRIRKKKNCVFTNFRIRVDGALNNHKSLAKENVITPYLGNIVEPKEAGKSCSSSHFEVGESDCFVIAGQRTSTLMPEILHKRSMCQRGMKLELAVADWKD